MWGTSEHDSGFNNVTAAGGFLPTESDFHFQTSQGDKKKFERINNLVPCTIAQVFNVSESDGHLKIGSMPVQMLTVVGIVLSVEEQSTKIIYLLDDMTATPIEVHMWLGENDDFATEKRSCIMENTYARATGTMRIVKGKHLITAFKVSPILDINEITMHLLEVIHASMAIAVMDNQPYPSNKVSIDNSFNTGQRTQYNTPSRSTTSGLYGNMTAGLSKPQQMVFRAVASYPYEDGASIQYLFSTLKSLNKQMVKDAIEFLSNEGHIYSTIDDDHFKATDAS